MVGRGGDDQVLEARLTSFRVDVFVLAGVIGDIEVDIDRGGCERGVAVDRDAGQAAINALGLLCGVTNDGPSKGLPVNER